MIKLGHLILENTHDTIALFPGGFKPFHSGHFNLVMSVPANKVIIFVSPKDKYGLTYNNAVSIIRLYKNVFPAFSKKIEISNYSKKYPSPVTAMYELLRSGKLKGKTLILAKSHKNADDTRFKLFHKYADEGQVTVKLYNYDADMESNDYIGSKKIMELVGKDKIESALKYFPKELVNKKRDKLISILTDTASLTEGGNVFDDVDSIKREYIEPTMEKFSAELQRLFPNFRAEFSRLGSVGKKNVSGDIDLGLSSKLFFDKNGNPRLKEWGFDTNEYKLYFDKFTKRARTSKPDQIALRAMLTLMAQKINENSLLIDANDKSSSTSMLFSKFPQYDENGKKLPLFIQIDMMVGDIDWLEFSYYSDVYKDNVKGLHRTQLLVALFSNKGYTFSHVYGVKNKETQDIVAKTPDEAISLLNKLYKLKLNKQMMSNYFTLMEYLKKTLKSMDYSDLIDTYLKILDTTRADIPTDLQDDWLQRKDRLGLTGKFLPDDSNLIKHQTITESGSIGADRIRKDAIESTFRLYVDKVLKRFKGFKDAKISGSYNTPSDKLDYGDIDLIITLDVAETDKKKIKKMFANYIDSLPDDISVPFTSGRHVGKKSAGTGDIVIAQFPIAGHPGMNVQIDNMIVTSDIESDYRKSFLDLPAEKQGLLVGLAKAILLEEPSQQVFDRLGIKNIPEPTEGQEYEFNISNKGLSLRLVTLGPNYKQLHRDEVWNTFDWRKIPILFKNFNIKNNFEDLLNEVIRKLKNPRSGKRVKGIFNSLVVINSGEQGTPKGEHKKKMIDLVNKKL